MGYRFSDGQNVHCVIRLLYDENGEAFGFNLIANIDNLSIDIDTNFYYVKNAQGDVVRVVDENGETVLSYTYDAWGNMNPIFDYNEEDLIPICVFAFNPVTYRGYYYDNDLEMYYLRSRYYNPQWGRFLNADEQLNVDQSVLGANLFAYCLNNPVIYVDSEGQSAAATKQLTSIGVFTALVMGAGIIVAPEVFIPICAVALTSGAVALDIALKIKLDNVRGKLQTRTLPDVGARLSNAAVYRLAYLDDDGNLNVVGRNMTFTQAIAKLGITGATNTLKNVYMYDIDNPSSAESQMKGYGKYWGIYTSGQAYAKALAIVFGCDKVPEVHGDGYYGHYHDSTHSFHIWFGNPISY